MNAAGPSGRASLLRQIAVTLGATSGIGLLMTLYRHMDRVAAGEQARFIKPLSEELTAVWLIGLLSFGVRYVARRWRLDRPGRARNLAIHLLALAVYAPLHTSLMWATRVALFPLIGLGPYDYGRMPHRYLMEVPVQLIVYGLIVTGVHVAARAREARARVLAAVQLEGQLAQARLHNLELQLRPHFLFNALNTISATMYDDPRAADEMIGHLASLLRGALASQGAPEHRLRDELLTLEHYLALQRARFGAGLTCRLEIDPPALDLAVPCLLLQPLVENAVRHGHDEAVGRVDVRVAARRSGDDLHIVVEDDGRGGSVKPSSGLGLALTRERLQLLYGSRQHFEAGPGEQGYRVRITLPARTLAD